MVAKKYFLRPNSFWAPISKRLMPGSMQFSPCLQEKHWPDFQSASLLQAKARNWHFLSLCKFGSSRDRDFSISINTSGALLWLQEMLAKLETGNQSTRYSKCSLQVSKNAILYNLTWSASPAASWRPRNPAGVCRRSCRNPRGPFSPSCPGPLWEPARRLCESPARTLRPTRPILSRHQYRQTGGRPGQVLKLWVNIYTGKLQIFKHIVFIALHMNILLG